MKRFHPSPALFISLIALFVALGGTSYAAINSLPANSVGTKQIKNGAVTAAKLASGQSLASGETEVGDWGFGGHAAGEYEPVASFPLPLDQMILPDHRIYVVGGSATHCPGIGHAAPGYLCVYEVSRANATAPDSSDIFIPETDEPGPGGAGGFAILLGVGSADDWFVVGRYAVTAP